MHQTLAQVVQRNVRCPIPGSGCLGPGQPDLAEDVHARCRGCWTSSPLKVSSNPKYPMVVWLLKHLTYGIPFYWLADMFFWSCFRAGGFAVTASLPSSKELECTASWQPQLSGWLRMCVCARAWPIRFVYVTELTQQSTNKCDSHPALFVILFFDNLLQSDESL